MRVALAGRTNAFDSCTIVQRISSPLASPAEVASSTERVRLEWSTQLQPGDTAEVQITAPSGEWTSRSRVLAGPEGVCIYEDREPTPGTTSRYRLAAIVNGVPCFSAETTVEVPRITPFAVHGLRPNPSHGNPALAFDLATRGDVRVEVFDLSGRRVQAATLKSVTPGPHTVPLDPAGELRPGLYLIRLTHGAQSRITRGLIVR